MVGQVRGTDGPFWRGATAQGSLLVGLRWSSQEQTWSPSVGNMQAPQPPTPHWTLAMTCRTARVSLRCDINALRCITSSDTQLTPVSSVLYQNWDSSMSPCAWFTPSLKPFNWLRRGFVFTAAAALYFLCINRQNLLSCLF